MQVDGLQNYCMNSNCLVFQPEAGAPTALGDVIEPVSQPKGVKQSITIKIVKVRLKSTLYLSIEKYKNMML
jgi:hypothetical protein